MARKVSPQQMLKMLLDGEDVFEFERPMTISGIEPLVGKLDELLKLTSERVALEKSNAKAKLALAAKPSARDQKFETLVSTLRETIVALKAHAERPIEMPKIEIPKAAAVDLSPLNKALAGLSKNGERVRRPWLLKVKRDGAGFMEELRLDPIDK